MTSTEEKPTRNYYESLGEGCDKILRCNDCKNLVTHTSLVTGGSCPKCGNRKVVEVRGLSLWEWLKIRAGILDFPHRDKFLAEFGARW